MDRSGGATLVGALDDRAVGDLGGEASMRQAVTLTGAGDAIAFVVRPEYVGANAIVLRYSVPDAPTGGGQSGGLALAITAPDGRKTSYTLTVTSRYSWLYGSVAAGTKLYNTQVNADTYDGASLPIHLYDEVQLMLAAPLAAGTTVTFADPTLPTTIDFAEIEVVAAPLDQPADLLSITDPSCGAMALDVRGTNHAFDGSDDSSYASMFDVAIGINPFNPTAANGVQNAGTQEKDTYSTTPGDPLQDDAMFALADQNFGALATCLAIASAPSSGYRGVWIPPGRFYARGSLAVPSNVTIQGAGIWYSKLTAVDTAPPMAVTNPNNGLSGIASVSGNLRFTSAAGGSSNVTLSDFAMFGNITQRDDVDRISPAGVVGNFTASRIARLWIEHYGQGVLLNQASSGDEIDGVRVRSTFADGLDFYGETSSSTIHDSTVRGTGDDGYAIWSQSPTSVSSGNTLARSIAELPWFGNGFGIYGGTNVTLDSDAAYDTLTGAGLKLATEFVPPTLPSSFMMTSVMVSNATVVRCGGNAFGQRYGAVLIGAMVESIDGMTIDHVVVDSPTYAAFDVRLLSNIGTVMSPGAVTNLTISNASVIGATTCAQVSSLGTATLDVCACSDTGGGTVICGVDNQAPSTFSIIENSCSAATCGG